MSINPPTGKEKPQKHYGSPYLGEIEDAQQRLRNAAATGTEPDLSDLHATAIAAAVPSSVPVLHEGQTFEEANGDLNETDIAAKAEALTKEIAEKDAADASAYTEAERRKHSDAANAEKSKAETEAKAKADADASNKAKADAKANNK